MNKYYISKTLLLHLIDDLMHNAYNICKTFHEKLSMGEQPGISIREYLEGLSVDQLHFAKERIDEHLKAAADSGKRIVWRVARNGLVIEENFREEDCEKACDLFLSIFKENFMKCADLALNERKSLRLIMRDLPSIDAELVTQVEYDAEWFPADEKPA